MRSVAPKPAAAGASGRRALRLHHRLVLPFIAVAFVTIAAVAALAVSLIRGALESRASHEVRNTAAVVSRSDFALNPAIIRTVKEITGADVITANAHGDILASTLPDAAPLLAAVGGTATVLAALSGPDDGPLVLTRSCGGVPCYAAIHRLTNRPDAAVAVIVRTTDVTSATAAIARALVLSAGAATMVMMLVSQVVARRVTAPIDALVAFTRSAAPGAPGRRARAGSDEIGRLAAAFNEMLDRLDRTQQALVGSEKLAVAGLLAARVAHDIRNPLSSIKMQAQLLRGRIVEGDERSLLDAVLHDVDQVEAVIRGLLELSRPGELTRAPGSINDVVGQVLQRLAPQFAHRKVEIATAFDPNLPLAPIDAGRLEQAVLNVVLNAAEAMPFGGTMTVTTRAAGGAAELEICDDGTGVAPELLDRVFDPFVSTKRDGVGLGLVNTKAVIESHGGSIAIAPRAPRGTTVRMTIPLEAIS